jgi:hypothetical protein
MLSEFDASGREDRRKSALTKTPISCASLVNYDAMVKSTMRLPHASHDADPLPHCKKNDYIERIKRG